MRRLMSLFLAVILLLSVSAVVMAAEDTYTVTYVADGEVVSTQEVAQGKDAVAPEIPGKFGYTQIAPQWDKDGKNITEDTTIIAVYTLNQYEVTYKVDGEVYKRLTYLHGEDVPMIPTPAKDGYIVTWDTIIDVLTDDITVNAVFTEIATNVPTQVTDDETGEEQKQWNNEENNKWTPIILGGTIVLIVILVLLQIQKKKNDKKISEKA